LAFNLTLQSPSGHYMYRTSVTMCTANLNFTILRSAHTAVFMCFVWISEQTAIISLYSINWLVCITETECVYCAVRAETNVIHASFPLSFHDFSLHFGNNDYRLRSARICSIVNGYRRFGRTCFLQLKVKEGHHRLEGAAPSRHRCLSTRLHFGCFEFYLMREQE